MQKAYLQSAIWHRKVIKGDPIMEVPYVFSQFSHEQMRIFIFRMLDAAYRLDTWNDGPPSKFMEFMETLEYAIDIAYLLYEGLMDKKKPIPVYIQPTKDQPVKRATAFLYRSIPRMLTINELKDPTRFIKQFFRFADIKEWKRMLKDRSFLALDIDDYRTLELPVDGLVLYANLSKLIDLIFIIQYQMQSEQAIAETPKDPAQKDENK